MPANEPFADVVVVIPGIGGSVLARGSKEIWAPRPGAALRAVLSLGSSIKDLELDGDDPTATDLGDGITATRLVPDLHVIPGLGWKIDGYGRLREQLVGRLGLSPGRNYFELPYDWRRDNTAAAHRLADNAERWLEARRQDGHPDARLILVGHSMGGIVARIFLELLGGWRQTRALVSFGTPYSGSVNALEFLSGGFRKGWGPITIDLTDTLRSFTSVYQLLPSYRCMATNDGLDYIDRVADVPGLDTTSTAAAMALHRRLRATVDDHRTDDYEGTGGYDIRPVVGDFQVTKSSARIDAGELSISNLRGGADERGDGTVPKVSAMPHELLDGWVNAAFMSEKHASLQNDDAVIDHLCGVLASTDIDLVDVFPAGDVPVAVTVDDALLGEPVTLTAAVRDPGFAPEVTAERLGLVNTATAAVELTADPDRPNSFGATIDDWPTGDYRMTVGGTGLASTTAIFSIVDPTDTIAAPGNGGPPAGG